MSYNIWSVNGFGICTDDISTDRDRLLSFIKQVPVFEKDFKEWIDSFAEDPDDITLEEMEEYEDEYGYTGIAPIMSAVIYELERIDLTVVIDVCGVTYLLLEPAYPWSNLSDEECNLTETALSGIFAKYCKMLTDAEIKPGYERAECGG